MVSLGLTVTVTVTVTATVTVAVTTTLSLSLSLSLFLSLTPTLSLTLTRWRPAEGCGSTWRPECARTCPNTNTNPNPNASPNPNPNQPAARVDLSLSLRACAEEELAPHAPLVHGAAFKDWNAIRSQGLGGHAPCRFWTRAPRKGERMFGMPRAPDVLVYVRCVGSGLGDPLP